MNMYYMYKILLKNENAWVTVNGVTRGREIGQFKHIIGLTTDLT